MTSSSSDTLSPVECFALVKGTAIGRIVFSDRALPGCSPVSFVLDSHTIVFRVDAGSRLAVAVDHAVVAFEADEIDPSTGQGWSVLITGDAIPVTRFSDQLRATRLGVIHGDSDTHQYWVRLTPGIVTGQRVHTFVPATLTADPEENAG
jgi:nitroimidazol reductase NimA-like FMN-containing flavoprotein (pyridoxamine 5'-phosphate oxidase superfamily)